VATQFIGLLNALLRWFNHFKDFEIELKEVREIESHLVEISLAE
jgi:hypothetical protein